VPRDVDPAIGRLPGCVLLDVAQLHGSTSAIELERAEAIVLAEAERFRAWQRSLAVVPVLGELRRRAEEIRAESLARYEGEDRDRVEALTAQLVARILHAPMVELKRAAAGSTSAADAETIRRLFALGPGTA
jgi:glutamyl-tRNA reductase